MSTRDHLAMAALCLSAALTSGAAVTLLSSPADTTVSVVATPLIRTIPVQTSAIPAPRLRPGHTGDPDPAFSPGTPQAPFGFVPLHATHDLFAALAEVAVAPEHSDPWSTETTPSSLPQSIVRLPSGPVATLPWQQPPQRTKNYSLSERLHEISPSAKDRLQRKFVAAKAPWSPAELALVAVKDEKTLELHARPAGGTWTFIHRYPVLAASGVSGPKLRRGDKQVPEGIYGISFLNANSRFHVALRVNYPNAFDRRMGHRDGRKDLGGDIMIHGKAESIGCLAIGDAAAEELFVLAAETGLKNIKLIVAPTDFRRTAIPARQDGQPAWLPQLYTEVALAMAPFKAPPSDGLLSYIFN
jgi:hypothetical protein